MKTIVRKEDRISVYLFADDVVIDVKHDCVIVGNPAQMVISDCHAGNVELIEQVSNPDDWYGWKYTFDGQSWALNPLWIDPRGSTNL